MVLNRWEMTQSGRKHLEKIKAVKIQSHLPWREAGAACPEHARAGGHADFVGGRGNRVGVIEDFDRLCKK